MSEQVSEKNPNVLLSLLSGASSFVVEAMEAIIVALALCTVLYLFLITPHEVIGQSMEPNFIHGEYLIANKLVYSINQPKRGEVVIFKHSATQDYIKRIIGLPGETLSLRDGRIYINGTMLDETTYLDPALFTSGGAVLKEGEDYKVPDGKYFVMGDNRSNSSDSRMFGGIEENDIKARAWIVYFPFNLFRIVTAPDYSVDQ